MKTKQKYKNQMITGEPIAKLIVKDFDTLKGEWLSKLTRAAVDFFCKNPSCCTHHDRNIISTGDFKLMDLNYDGLPGYLELKQVLKNAIMIS